MGGARLSTHRVGLSNFSAKNTPVTPWIPFMPPRIPRSHPRFPGHTLDSHSSTLGTSRPHGPASSRDTAKALPSRFGSPSETLQFSFRDTSVLLPRHFRGTSEPLQFSFRPSFAAFSLTFHTASVSLSVRAGGYFILDNYRMSMG